MRNTQLSSLIEYSTSFCLFVFLVYRGIIIIIGVIIINNKKLKIKKLVISNLYNLKTIQMIYCIMACGSHLFIYLYLKSIGEKQYRK